VRRPDTLRGQLVLLATMPMLLVLIASAAATYFIAYRVASRAYDYSLLDTARTIANLVHFTAGASPSIDLSPGVKEVLSYDPLDRVYYGVTSEEFGLLAGRGDLPVPDESSSEGLYYNGVVDAQPARLIALQLPSGVNIIVGETLRKREALTKQIVLAVLATEAVLVAVGGALLWYGIRRGMAPVQRIANALALRGHHDLRAIHIDPGAAELRSLVHSVNDLMGRLDSSLSMQHRFVADAAHQLRTPIAGLLAEIETALARNPSDEARASLEHLRVSSLRVARLVNQLLALARAAPGQQMQIDFKPVDLTALVRKTCADWVPEALRCGADLGYDGTDAPIVIEGNAPLLEDMTGNLIDNAIRYGHPGTVIDVSLQLENARPVLSVSNDGPAIPTAERERVFERFYRVPGSSGPGSGLGLAIVRDVARMHRAMVDVGVAGKRNVFKVTFGALPDLRLAS
jgi:two-component system sensor histidine kinase TctE